MPPWLAGIAVDAKTAVSVICGAVGSLVMSNRMAFFSDALAHCAFAGVGIGLLISMALRLAVNDQGLFYQWGLPLTLLALRPEHEALVVEIGANQPGEIATPPKVPWLVSVG